MKLNLLILIFLSFVFIGSSQEKLIRKIDLNIESTIYQSNRKVTIQLPLGYNEMDTSTKYVAAYLFDGQFEPYLSMVSSMSDYYYMTQEGIPLIIVSIHHENRSLELTPQWLDSNTFKGWRGNCGESAKLTEFLKEEVIPYVESTYNTAKYRLGIGHSLGGTYVLQELFSKNSLFNGVIAVSPNLNYDHEQIIESGKTYFKANPNSYAFIYSSVGDEAGMEFGFRRSLKKLDSIAKIESPKNLTWQTDYLDGENHNTTFPVTFNNAYLKFSKKFKISEDRLKELVDEDKDVVKQIQKFHNERAIFSGENETLTISDWNNYGYSVSYLKKFDKAIQLFNEGIKNYPKDANIHDSKGEILEEMGKLKEAKEEYELALKILKENKTTYDEEMYNYYLQTFTENIERLK